MKFISIAYRLGSWLTMAIMTNAVALAQSEDSQACDAATHYQVVHASTPSAASIGSQAYWLDRQHLQWPQVAAQGVFKLYYSSQAGLHVVVGAPVTGADGAVLLAPASTAWPSALAQRFKHLQAGVQLRLSSNDQAMVAQLLRQQLLLVQEDDMGRTLRVSALQTPGVLDDLYAQAEQVADLGARVSAAGSTRFRVWAPTAQQVMLCLYPNASAAAQQVLPMRWDARTGVWQADSVHDLNGKYYRYLVQVLVPGWGVVRNRVTDPYSISLSANSERSYIADLNAPELQPPGWAATPAPNAVRALTDMVIYELHVRDFSVNDASVPPPHRGKYLGFTHGKSRGMRHLRALARAGLTDVHLLPVFDIATIVESGCIATAVPGASADSEEQQAAVMAKATGDCFNWGYDPFHFNAPEGSYATDAHAARRVVELRAMVQALHRSGLRVGMDVVYNHTAASGQSPLSVLDRIVPGYYHRRDANGQVERSTCCDNTATEHLMMGKLMLDSVLHWARHYKIDSFRFDLMGHQPLALMQTLKARLRNSLGREVQLIGEGWNFGEVADGARFVQAEQKSLANSGIGSFSDRARDAIRGGSAGDSGAALVKNQGYINGLVYDPNALADGAHTASKLLKAADLVRVGLAGTLRSYRFTDYTGKWVSAHEVDYNGQAAAYAAEPGEVVNYVENHDNQTLFDINAYRLPLSTSSRDRVRVQMLGAALNALSQGVAYFHAGVDTLRSKSLDGNSFDSGDWFNRIDWSYRDNYFGTGAPPAADNRANYPWIKPLLARADIKPTPADIALARDMFRDLLKIRASSSLFRLRSAADVQQRLTFFNTGPQQNPVLQIGHLDGRGYRGARFKEILYVVNVDKRAHQIELPPHRGKRFVLHPAQRRGADAVVARWARFEAASARIDIPARSAAVFVLN